MKMKSKADNWRLFESKTIWKQNNFHYKTKYNPTKPKWADINQPTN